MLTDVNLNTVTGDSAITVAVLGTLVKTAISPITLPFPRISISFLLMVTFTVPRAITYKPST